MYDNILAAINDQDWKRAVRELNDVVKNSDFNEKIAILAATIFNHIGDSKTAYNMICKGLLIDSRNCELWLMLGQTYELQNPDQAYLCYENALFYSNDESDKELINSYIKNLMESAILTVKKSSIVILSYNSLEFTKECIASIEKTCPESAYEIVIVDNHSEDGSVEWLKRKSGIKLVTNDKNMGFPKGCNQGIEISERENDIFLLNNDTILCENSLFWLRMGLYESENVGATGSVSNYVSNGQMSSISESTIERMIEKGRLNNAIVNVPVVEKMYLVGFAVLIRRSALEKIGYLDERFTPGTYEDNDLGLRLKANGYSVRLCRNSFIFHYGSGNGKNLNKWNGLYAINNRKIDEKWHFDTKKVMYPDLSVVEQVISRKRDKLKVLEIGCELGATLIEIKNKVPDVEVFGIENDDSLFKVTNKYIDCNQIKDLTKELPYPEAYFDYIIAKSIKGDLKYLAGVYSNLRRYLAKDGEIISPMYSLVELSHHVEIKPSINIDYYSGSDNYSDGDVEDEIINILLNNATEHYDEAIYENYSWPTYYHLSGIRKNILNWYPFKEGADALEIGCGMGAITSVLCDKCKTVTSVELSLRRATATLVRCRHRDNLQVIVGNLNDIEFPKKYDYITLIGVLEYQGKYTDGDNPYKDFIVKIKQLLKPNGKLLVAIENQYGLKYWCGAFEDHTGTPFNGINQYIYSGRGVKTFSRNGLEQLLKESGFNNTFFYYPMPDYKFPEKVFSDEYLPKEGDLAALKYYYLNTSGVVADESKLYDDIISNGVFKFFANSFLVECSDDSHLGEVIFSSSPIIRKREYAVQTNISRTSDGKWVEKVALFPEATPFLDQIIENERFLKGNGRSVISSERTNKGIKQKFIAGDSLDGRLVRLYMEKEKSSILDLWDLIYKSISAKIIDTVPKNAIIENNNITWFDQEWREENSDIDYVMFRALLVFYVAHPFAENIVSINELYERYNILCKKDMFLCREKELYRTIFDATLLVETDYFCPSGINNIITDNLKKLMSSHTTAIAKEAEKDINKDDLYDKIKKGCIHRHTLKK